MQPLVFSRPIPLPVLKQGGWYDDFIQSSGKNSSYVINGDGIIKATENGIKLQRGSTTLFLGLPDYFKGNNFEAEIYMRRVTANNLIFAFKALSPLNLSNRWLVRFNSSTSDSFDLLKIVDGVTTVMGQKSNVGGTNFHRVNIKVVGSNISVGLDGVNMFDINSIDHINNGYFFVTTASTSNGDYSEIGYLVIKPL